MKKEVKEKFDSYPADVKKKMLKLRDLIFITAKENDVSAVEECLKWGEPAYISKKGSVIRIDWKSKTPNEYAMYFNCNTKLVETFKEIYPQEFKYLGNRAIVFSVKESIPEKQLKVCISLSLKYHLIKKLPLLGV